MDTTDNSPIIIPQSKTKLLLLLLISIVFVAFGCWFLILPGTFKDAPIRNPWLLSTSGGFAIVFFGFCGVYVLRKLGDKHPGIVIDERGITDNASGVAAGLITWEDIAGIKLLEIAGQNLLLIEVNDPEIYISRQQGFVKKKLMGINFKSYGTPISLSANGLKCSFDELNNLVNEGCKKFIKA